MQRRRYRHRPSKLSKPSRPNRSHRTNPRWSIRSHHLTKASWWTFFVVITVAPIIIMMRWGHLTSNLPVRISFYCGLIAIPVVVITYIMTARSPSVLSAFGVERVLRAHRAAGLVFVALIVLHLVFVVAGDPRHFTVFDLPEQKKQVWAGFTSLTAFALLAMSAVNRKARLRRYEGWRMAHVSLTVIGLLSAALHVIWLRAYRIHPAIDWVYWPLGLTLLVAALHRWWWRPWRASRRPYQVDSVVKLPDDTVSVVLTAQGHDGVPFSAGQFAWLKIGKSPYVFEDHPFTISSAATRPARKEFTVKALGDFTELLVALRPGRRVFLDGPYGQFTTDRVGPTAGFVLIGGGVGITPLLSILRTLADERYTQRITLIMSARSHLEITALAAVQELGGQLDLGVTLLVGDSLPPGFLPAGWRGEVGRISHHRLRQYLPKTAPIFHDYFVCGPPRMVADLTRILPRYGVPKKRIHTELFDVA
jgi:predicted ferric reductase